MANLSWRHHYIPQFYLKEFLNKDNKFFIYDKLNDKIKDNSYSTKSHFFEKNRNTIKINNQYSDSIESKILKSLDDNFSKLYKKIVEEKEFINPRNIVTLCFFLNYLHWRIPKNDPILKKYIKDYDFKKILKLTDFNKNSVIQKLEEIKDNENFIKLIKIAIPPYEIDLENIQRNISKWHQINIPFSNSGLTSDAPIIKLKNGFLFENNQKFLFPISSKKILYFGDTNKTEIEKDFFINFDLEIINNSQRYVCATNKDYLKDIVNLYRIEKKFDKLNGNKLKLLENIE